MKILRLLAGALALASAPALAQSNDSAAVKLTVGGAPVAAGTALIVTCSSQASVTLTLGDGSTLTITPDAGTIRLPLAVTAVTGGGYSVPCSFYSLTAGTSGGGGGGGGGDASSTNQATQITAANLTNTRLGDVASPATGSTNQRLSVLDTRLQSVITALGTPLQAGGAIGNTGFGALATVVSGDQAYTVGSSQQLNLTATGRLKVGLSSAGQVDAAAQPSTQTTADLVGCKNRSSSTMTAGQTAALACDANGALMVSSSSTTPTNATPGSATPAYAQQVAGRSADGNLRAVATDTGGRLLPGQGVVATTRTTLTASTATALEAAGVSGRIGVEAVTEAALTAPVFICTTQTTSCSATSYDFILPSGAGAGSGKVPLFASTGRYYAFSTAAAVIVLGSWTAQ